MIAVADGGGAVAESLENNNTRASVYRADRTRLDGDRVTGPSSAVAGTSISASDTTKNQGVDTAPASVTNFYLSSNSSLDAADVLGVSSVSLLGAGLSEVGSALLLIPVNACGQLLIIAKGDGATRR